MSTTETKTLPGETKTRETPRTGETKTHVTIAKDTPSKPSHKMSHRRIQAINELKNLVNDYIIKPIRISDDSKLNSLNVLIQDIQDMDKFELYITKVKFKNKYLNLINGFNCYGIELSLEKNKNANRKERLHFTYKLVQFNDGVEIENIDKIKNLNIIRKRLKTKYRHWSSSVGIKALAALKKTDLSLASQYLFIFMRIQYWWENLKKLLDNDDRDDKDDKDDNIGLDDFGSDAEVYEPTELEILKLMLHGVTTQGFLLGFDSIDQATDSIQQRIDSMHQQNALDELEEKTLKLRF